MEQDKAKYKSFIIDDVKYKTLYHTKYEKRKKYELANPNVLKSFLPGKILNISVNEGDRVLKGTELCILEAMKMENIIRSTVNGTVIKIHIQKGSVIPKNTLLMEFESDDETETETQINIDDQPSDLSI